MGLRSECCFVSKDHLRRPNSKKCTSLSGPENVDHPVDSDHVAPNLLFAQQISNICCFTALTEGTKADNLEIRLIKKGYMEQDNVLHWSNTAGSCNIGSIIADDICLPGLLRYNQASAPVRFPDLSLIVQGQVEIFDAILQVSSIRGYTVHVSGSVNKFLDRVAHSQFHS